MEPFKPIQRQFRAVYSDGVRGIFTFSIFESTPQLKYQMLNCGIQTHKRLSDANNCDYEMILEKTHMQQKHQSDFVELDPRICFSKWVGKLEDLKRKAGWGLIYPLTTAQPYREKII